MTTRRLRRALAATGATCVVAAVVAPPAVAQAGPESARYVVVCQGDAPPCETNEQLNAAGDEHLVTALVTDRAGSPVADVPVELREEGVGRFTTGGDSTVVLTDAGGRAQAVVTADQLGDSYVWAEISPPGTPGGFRGYAANDDECEQPAGPGGEPAAGNCAAGPVYVYWEVPPEPLECSDGIDNDGDGQTDMDDPFCESEHDPSESTVDVSDTRWRREVTLSFGHWTRDRVLVLGRVKVLDAGPAECFAGAAVRILRRSGGRWDPVATVTTSREGWYVVAMPDRPGRYRATALRFEPGYVGNTYTTCMKAHHAKRHRHA